MLDNLDMQARIRGSSRDWEGTRKTAEQGLRLAAKATAPAVEILERRATLAYAAQAAYNNLDRMEEALRYGQMSVELRREIHKLRGSRASASNLATTLLGMASTLRYAGDLQRAEEQAREGRRVLEQRYETEPTLSTGRLLVWALFQEARVLGSREGISMGRWQEASALLERSVTLARELAKSDAEDTATRNNLASAAAELASLRLETDAASALALYDEAYRWRNELPAQHVNNTEKLHMMAGSVRALVRLRHLEEATARLEELLRILRERKIYPGKLEAGSYGASALRAKAELEEARGNRDTARQVWEEIAMGYEGGGRQADADLQWALAFSEAYRALARLGEANEAAAWREKDQAIWRRWASRLPASAFVEGQLRASR